MLHREFPRDGTGSLVLSPDGKRVAITGANTRKLYLWDWQGADEPRELKVPRQRVDHLAFAPDSKALLACGYPEPFVYEWDVATGDLKHQIEIRDDIFFNGLAITPDGQAIAVTDYGNRKGKNFSGGVFLLERGTGRLSARAADPEARRPRTSFFSPDGRAGWRHVAGVGVHVWDSGEGPARKQQSRAPPVIKGGINQIATTPGGLIATASDDHSIRLWDAATGTERRRLPHGHWVRAIAVSPDGQFLASSSLDDSVRLWDLPSGKEIYKLAPGHGLHGGHRTVGFHAGRSRRFLSWATISTCESGTSGRGRR